MTMNDWKFLIIGFSAGFSCGFAIFVYVLVSLNKFKPQVKVVEGPPVVQLHRVDVVYNADTNYASGFRIDLPISEDEMILTARTILSTGKFTHAALAGQEGGKPLTRDKYEGLRNVLVGAKLIRERVKGQHRSGYTWDTPGRRFFEYYANLRTTEEREDESPLPPPSVPGVEFSPMSKGHIGTHTQIHS